MMPKVLKAWSPTDAAGFRGRSKADRAGDPGKHGPGRRAVEAEPPFRQEEGRGPRTRGQRVAPFGIPLSGEARGRLDRDEA